MPVTKKRSPIQHDYTLHGHVLEQVPTAKYLGLNLHEQLSWNFHTDMIAKANRTRAFIARNIHSCPKKVEAACYTTLVCHHCLGFPHCAELLQIRTGPATCCSVCMPQVRETSQCDSSYERFEVGVTGDEA